jgi:hypothetical protein
MSSIITLEGGDLVSAVTYQLLCSEIKEVDELNHQEANWLVVDVQNFLKSIEALRVEAIAPHLEAQRAINARAKEIVGNLETEKTRINRAIGNYGALLAAKARAEQAKLVAEATAREKEAQDAIAVATSADEVTEIRERLCQEVAATQIAVEQIVPTVKVKEDWDIQVLDAAALYAAHPEAVELCPRLSVIKALAKARNGAVAGVICNKVNVARPR